MREFIFGVIFGIIVSTVGFTGIAKLFDNGVHKLQDTVKEQSS
jgi:hypothetical protein